MGVQNREASMAGRIVFLGLGAALMYLMDPQAGKKRRNDLKNQLESAQRSVQRGKDMGVRAATNRDLRSLARGEGIPVQKTIRIAAPVAEVYAYWRNLENFPQWMSHVREVRYIGGDRYHWTVEGPAGVPVEWDAELLN